MDSRDLPTPIHLTEETEAGVGVNVSAVEAVLFCCHKSVCQSVCLHTLKKPKSLTETSRDHFGFVSVLAGL